MYKTLEGQKIGRLTIGEEFKKNRRIYYHCKCDCGKNKDIYRNHLISGNTTSCGCYSRELISKNTSKDYTNQCFGNLKTIKNCQIIKIKKHIMNVSVLVEIQELFMELI